MNPPMFYFLLALTSVLAATANAGGPVLDVDGDIIFRGSYYVIPVFRGAASGGGGLTLSPRGNSQCPLYLVQESSELNRGIPVKFSNWRSRVGFVPESEDLNIETDKATKCFQSTYWWATPPYWGSSTWFVEAGPEPSGEDSWRSFFQIKKTGDFSNGYEFSFCPKGNDCIDVGIFDDEDGVRRLALSSTPFPVVFVKANGTETSSKTMSII